jgi:hypothetical protein
VTFDAIAAMLSATRERPVRYQPASIVGYAWHLRRKHQLPLMQILVQTMLHVGLRRGGAATVDPTLARVLGHPARTIGQYIRDAAPRWRAAASS